MKVICTTEHLRTAVINTERFTGKHITLPILSYLLFTVKERKIVVTATNLETGIEHTIPGKVQKPGVVTTPAKTLTQILQTLPDETITLEGHQNQLILHTPTSDITIHGLNPSDFPNLPTIKREYSFTIPTEIFSLAIHQVLPAAAATDLKPQLAGLFLSVASGTLVLAATDSFRLAEKAITNVHGITGQAECIIPAQTMREVLRAIPPGGELTVSVGEHQVVFEWNETQIISQLIEGPYPPYKTIIPSNYETTMVVERDDFLKKIRLASVFSSRLHDVTLQMSPHELVISTTNTDAGGTVARLPAKGRGAAGSVVFNYHYLLDGLEAIAGEHVTLHVNGVSGPTLIQDHTDPSYRYLLMPIRAA